MHRSRCFPAGSHCPLLDRRLRRKTVATVMGSLKHERRRRCWGSYTHAEETRLTTIRQEQAHLRVPYCIRHPVARKPRQNDRCTIYCLCKSASRCDLRGSHACMPAGLKLHKNGRAYEHVGCPEFTIENIVVVCCS